MRFLDPVGSFGLYRICFSLCSGHHILPVRVAHGALYDGARQPAISQDDKIVHLDSILPTPPSDSQYTIGGFQCFLCGFQLPFHGGVFVQAMEYLGNVYYLSALAKGGNCGRVAVFHYDLPLVFTLGFLHGYPPSQFPRM
jgi:hypothetical protein